MLPPKIRPRPAKSDQASENKARAENGAPVIAAPGKVSEVVDRADQEAPADSVVEDRAAASAVVPVAAAN